MDFQKILHLRIFMKTYTPNQYLLITETMHILSEGLYAFLYFISSYLAKYLLDGKYFWEYVVQKNETHFMTSTFTFLKLYIKQIRNHLTMACIMLHTKSHIDCV